MQIYGVHTGEGTPYENVRTAEMEWVEKNNRYEFNPMDEEVVSVGMYWQKRQDELARAKQQQAESVQRVIDTVLKHERWQSQGSAKDSVYLNPTIQPRMPWQDYQMRIFQPSSETLFYSPSPINYKSN